MKRLNPAMNLLCDKQIPSEIRTQFWELKTCKSVGSLRTNAKTRFLPNTAEYEKTQKITHRRSHYNHIKTLDVNSLQKAGYRTVTSKLFACGDKKTQMKAIRYLNNLASKGVFRTVLRHTRPVQFVF